MMMTKVNRSRLLRKKTVVSAEVIKNCVKYIFIGRYLLILLTRQFLRFKNDKYVNLNVNMIDTEKYQPARQNMKLVTRSLRSLANKFHILAR
jgi:uncharacterized protein YsxB (DUF464 family)